MEIVMDVELLVLTALLCCCATVHFHCLCSPAHLFAILCAPEVLWAQTPGTTFLRLVHFIAQMFFRDTNNFEVPFAKKLSGFKKGMLEL